MTGPIDEYLERLRRFLGPAGDWTVAEVRDHLSSSAERYRAGGCAPGEAERRAVDAFGGDDPEAVPASLACDLEEAIRMDDHRTAPRWTAAVAVVAIAVGASAATANASSSYAAPGRVVAATILLALVVVGLRHSLLGAVGIIGAAQVGVVLAGAALSLDRDGLGLGVVTAQAAVGVAYAWMSTDLVRAGALRHPLAAAVGSAVPVAAVLRAIADFARVGDIAVEAYRSLSALALAVFAAALGWLVLRLWRSPDGDGPGVPAGESQTAAAATQ